MMIASLEKIIDHECMLVLNYKKKKTTVTDLDKFAKTGQLYKGYCKSLRELTAMQAATKASINSYIKLGSSKTE
jgi:hypothetical protein